MSLRGMGIVLTIVSLLSAACVLGINQGESAKEEVVGVGESAATTPVDAGPDAPPRRVCPSESLPNDGGWVTTDGFDVSDYQFTDWDKVKADNPSKKFAFVRVSAGLVRIDKRFKIDWPSAKRVGFIRGAYQYFKPSQSAIAQANLFLDKMAESGGLEDTDIPPVLDVEATNDMPTETIVCRIKTWLARVERATKRVPLIYTSHVHGYLFGPEMERHALWVANYVGTPSITCPRTPYAWDKWTIWQHSDRGPISGVYDNGDRNSEDGGTIAMDGGVPVSTGYDVNFFNGTFDALKTFIASTKSAGTVQDPPPLANPPVVPGAASVAGGPVDCADDGCCVPGP